MDLERVNTLWDSVWVRQAHAEWCAQQGLSSPAGQEKYWLAEAGRASAEARQIGEDLGQAILAWHQAELEAARAAERAAFQLSAGQAVRLALRLVAAATWRWAVRQARRAVGRAASSRLAALPAPEAEER